MRKHFYTLLNKVSRIYSITFLLSVLFKFIVYSHWFAETRRSPRKFPVVLILFFQWKINVDINNILPILKIQCLMWDIPRITLNQQLKLYPSLVRNSSIFGKHSLYLDVSLLCCLLASSLLCLSVNIPPDLSGLLCQAIH